MFLINLLYFLAQIYIAIGFLVMFWGMLMIWLSVDPSKEHLLLPVIPKESIKEMRKLVAKMNIESYFRLSLGLIFGWPKIVWDFTMFVPNK